MVEAAVMLPLLIFVTLGTIDVSQYINLAQVVCNASREGARIASRDTTIDEADVRAAVRGYFEETFPSLNSGQMNQTLTVTVYDGNNNVITGSQLAGVASGSGMRVVVQFNFDAIRWLPGMEYFTGGVNRRETSCRRE